MSSNYPYEYELCLDMENSNTNLEGFKPITIVTEIVGVILIILVIIWCSSFRGGFAWKSDPKLEFNWHPLLMVIGFVFLYANAMLIYRTQRGVRKPRLKLTHAALTFAIIIFVIIALVAVFDSHNLSEPPIPNLYSLHSWLGLTSVILFCCQWLAGLATFLYPGLRPSIRSAYYPIHVYFGIAGFVGVIASCLLGLNEKAIFALGADYSNLVDEAVLINIIGLFLVIFGGLAVYLVSQERYKRLPKPEDEALVSGRQ